MVQPIPFGDFRLHAPVAAGGMGAVWRGTHVASGLPVSVKVMTGRRASDPLSTWAFRSEVRSVAALDHPGIILVLDFGAVPDAAAEASGGRLVAGSPYLVMEHASGGSLRDVGSTPMPWPELRATLLALLDALAHAHARGVIHRDLKPANVLVCDRGDPRPGPKLSDFGLARVYEDSDRRGSHEEVRGTLHYMAPEQAQGRWRDQGPWTDLYALGVMAYKLASGRVPFLGRKGDALLQAHIAEPAPALPPRRGLPEGFDGWVRRLLRKKPEERFRRAADAAWALLQLSEPSDTGPVTWAHLPLADALGLGDVATRATEAPPADTVPLMAVDQVWALSSAPESQALDTTRQHDAPPIPPTWRSPRAPVPSLQLYGAGLGVLGARSLPIVGRQRERDALWSALQDVHVDGRSRIALIRGAMGSGGSALASWMSRRAHEVGAATLLTLSNDPDAAPWAPLRRMVSKAVGAGRLDRPETHARVLDFLRLRAGAEVEGSVDTDAAALADFLHEPDTRVRSREERAALFGLLRRFVARSAVARPVLLRVEDLHHGRAALGFVRHLLDHGGRLPVLVVGTSRAGADDPRGQLAALARHARAVLLELQPLSRSERQALVRDLLGLEATLAERVDKVTGGNPLFAVEMVRDWALRSQLVPSDRGFVLADGAAPEVPDSLWQAWTDRLDHALDKLPPEAIEQVELAAVLGERVGLFEWAAVCGRSMGRFRSTAAALLGALLDAGLARGTLEGWRFSHPALRSTVLRRAREAGRLEAHHRQVAEGLEALGPQLVANYTARVGRHLSRAGELDDAFTLLLEALEQLRVNGAAREGLALVEVAEGLLAPLALAPSDARRGRLLLHRTEAHHHRGERQEAREAGAQLLAFARAHLTGAERADALLAVASSTLGTEEGQLATTLVDEARALVPADPSYVGLRLAACEATLARTAMDLDAAEAHVRRAAELAEALSLARPRAIAVRDLGILALMRADYAKADRYFREAETQLRAQESLKDLGGVMNNRGEVARFTGRLAEAERYYQEAAALYDRAGAAANAAYPLVNLALLDIGRERYGDALPRLTQALDVLAREQDLVGEVVARLALLPGCAAAGDWAGWRVQIDRVRALSWAWPHIDPDVIEAVQAAARLCREFGRADEAAEAEALAAEVAATDPHTPL